MKKKIISYWLYIRNVCISLYRYIRCPWFKADQSYLSLPSFWVPFCLILLLAILAWLQIWVTQDLKFNIQASLDETYQLFKIPLWILALLIPVLGLMNANHKSEQAREAMALSRSQNNFANYYKHLEEFAKYCKSIELEYSSNNLKISEREIHTILFPKGNAGNFNIPSDFLEWFRKHLVDIAKRLCQKRQYINGVKGSPNQGAAFYKEPKLFLNKYGKYINFQLDNIVKKNSMNESEKLIPIENLDVFYECVVLADVFHSIIKFDAHLYLQLDECILGLKKELANFGPLEQPQRKISLDE